ncbi:hypothetical protein CTRI78_v010813 [Colletotrichum trifolii]|uniref:Uncharacterized protein n=1 Tax=Colletotrichum trifolii TaxID=5466 RepID=A0A4V3HTI2_COLTR|nr:hypothetical protein CTRI78_v010813 [Colletotrichum trifolii]
MSQNSVSMELGRQPLCSLQADAKFGQPAPRAILPHFRNHQLRNRKARPSQLLRARLWETPEMWGAKPPFLVMKPPSAGPPCLRALLALSISSPGADRTRGSKHPTLQRGPRTRNSHEMKLKRLAGDMAQMGLAVDLIGPSSCLRLA